MKDITDLEEISEILVIDIKVVDRGKSRNNIYSRYLFTITWLYLSMSDDMRMLDYDV